MKRRRCIGGALLLAALTMAAHAQSYVQFFRALDVDNASAVGELLARGFDPNTPDESGHRPLYLALRSANFKVAAVLLAQPELKVDAMNGVGETALMMAALRGQLDWMQRLLERGAQINKEGWAPLHYAATGPEPRAVDMVLARGAKIDALSPNLSTALMMAVQYGAEDSARLLLERGADIKLRNRRGESAADIARRVGRATLAERLESAAR